MINFFRKIRKQLTDDNKPLKYMRYAIDYPLCIIPKHNWLCIGTRKC